MRHCEARVARRSNLRHLHMCSGRRLLRFARNDAGTTCDDAYDVAWHTVLNRSITVASTSSPGRAHQSSEKISTSWMP